MIERFHPLQRTAFTRCVRCRGHVDPNKCARYDFEHAMMWHMWCRGEAN